jgi:hypothetical protein
MRARAGEALFGGYLFIDYSGAKKVEHQRKAIRVAYGEATKAADLVEERYDRAALVSFIIEVLRSATHIWDTLRIGTRAGYFSNAVANGTQFILGWRIPLHCTCLPRSPAVCSRDESVADRAGAEAVFLVRNKSGSLSDTRSGSKAG